MQVTSQGSDAARRPGLVADERVLGRGRLSELRLRKEGLQWREVENEVLALETTGSTYLSANQTGALLWRRLAEGTTRAELVQALVTAYGIDEQSAGADVDSFLAELREHELLEG